MRIGVLVSGRGSNLQAILAAVASGQLDGIHPAVVISNRLDAPAIGVATAAGVRSLVLRRADFAGDASARDAAIGRVLTETGVQIAVLAGYDQLLRPSYFEIYSGRTINIHPSLLPAHGGMAGLAVHRSVLASGDAESGVTIHDVTTDMDAGPILAQSRVPVLPGDDAGTLAARVLVEEHRLLVSTLARVGVGG
ncbi:MAG: phosphoribosylglycinamide formyltransferase [Chloroflexota bacterium]|nr:phosphoribosylglycinamide formyltransferase [Chloroflexota bacterium]